MVELAAGAGARGERPVHLLGVLGAVRLDVRIAEEVNELLHQVHEEEAAAQHHLAHRLLVKVLVEQLQGLRCSVMLV